MFRSGAVLRLSQRQPAAAHKAPPSGERALQSLAATPQNAELPSATHQLHLGAPKELHGNPDAAPWLTGPNASSDEPEPPVVLVRVERPRFGGQLVYAARFIVDAFFLLGGAAIAK